jgi:hypothetical protein
MLRVGATMSEHLLIGILALFIAVILCVIGRPNVRGQSSLFFPSTPKPFLPIILIFATVALTELILSAVGR